MTTDGDQLAAVLREIDEMEESEGFIGPKISTNINAARELIERASIRLTDEDGVTWSCVIPREWVQDIVVGEIGRACRRGNQDGGMEIDFQARINGMYSATITVWRWGVMQKVISRFGDSLALAAATVYRDALKAGP